MTIAISIKVGEGLVLAADSMSSFFLENSLVQSYWHARKVLQLEKYPVGLLTYGLGSLGGRNLESLVAEFERSLPPFSDGVGYTIHDLASRLHQFMAAKYDVVFPPPDPALEPVDQPADAAHGDGAGNDDDAPQAPEGDDTESDTATDPPLKPIDTRPGLGIVIGGYGSGEFFSDEFEMLIPSFGPDEVWADLGAGERYGARWWGQTAAIERLYLGCDYRGFVEWSREIGVSLEDANAEYARLRERVMWPIIYEGMPLQDAIDLAVYLVNVTIGQSRFAVGPPVCGGHIDVATITSRGFQWIKRKDWQVKAASVFY